MLFLKSLTYILPLALENCCLLVASLYMFIFLLLFNWLYFMLFSEFIPGHVRPCCCAESVQMTLSHMPTTGRGP